MTDILGRLSTALADRYVIERQLAAGGIYMRTPVRRVGHRAVRATG